MTSQREEAYTLILKKPSINKILRLLQGQLALFLLMSLLHWPTHISNSLDVNYAALHRGPTDCPIAGLRFTLSFTALSQFINLWLTEILLAFQIMLFKKKNSRKTGLGLAISKPVSPASATVLDILTPASCDCRSQETGVMAQAAGFLPSWPETSKGWPSLDSAIAGIWWSEATSGSSLLHTLSLSQKKKV